MKDSTLLPITKRVKC